MLKTANPTRPKELNDLLAQRVAARSGRWPVPGPVDPLKGGE